MNDSKTEPNSVPNTHNTVLPGRLLQKMGPTTSVGKSEPIPGFDRNTAGPGLDVDHIVRTATDIAKGALDDPFYDEHDPRNHLNRNPASSTAVESPVDKVPDVAEQITPPTSVGTTAVAETVTPVTVSPSVTETITPVTVAMPIPQPSLPSQEVPQTPPAQA